MEKPGAKGDVKKKTDGKDSYFGSKYFQRLVETRNHMRQLQLIVLCFGAILVTSVWPVSADTSTDCSIQLGKWLETIDKYGINGSKDRQEALHTLSQIYQKKCSADESLLIKWFGLWLWEEEKVDSKKARGDLGKDVSNLINAGKKLKNATQEYSDTPKTITKNEKNFCHYGESLHLPLPKQQQACFFCPEDLLDDTPGDLGCNNQSGLLEFFPQQHLGKKQKKITWRVCLISKDIYLGLFAENKAARMKSLRWILIELEYLMERTIFPVMKVEVESTNKGGYLKTLFHDFRPDLAPMRKSSAKNSPKLALPPSASTFEGGSNNLSQNSNKVIKDKSEITNSIWTYRLAAASAALFIAGAVTYHLGYEDYNQDGKDDRNWYKFSQVTLAGAGVTAISGLGCHFIRVLPVRPPDIEIFSEI